MKTKGPSGRVQVKGVQVVVCGMKYINLNINLSYNELIAREKYFLKAISNIQGVLKLWSMRQLTSKEEL